MDRRPSSIAETLLDLVGSPVIASALHAWQQQLVEQYDAEQVGPAI